MNFPFEIFTLGALAGLVVTEAILKPILTRLTRRYGPATLSYLMASADDLLFWAIENNKTREEYEEAICLRMTAWSGEPWGKQKIDAGFKGGYDPRIALEKMK